MQLIEIVVVEGLNSTIVVLDKGLNLTDETNRGWFPTATRSTVLVKIRNERNGDLLDHADRRLHASLSSGVVLGSDLVRPPVIRAIVGEDHEKLGYKGHFRAFAGNEMTVLGDKLLELSETQRIVIVVDDDHVVFVVTVEPELALRTSRTMLLLGIVGLGPEVLSERRLAGAGLAP